MRKTIYMFAVLFSLAAAGLPAADRGTSRRGVHFIGWSDFAAFKRETDSSSREVTLTSPVVEAEIDWNELIVSWNAELPPEACLRLEVRCVYPNRTSRWYVMGRWSGDPQQNPRESVVKQKDADGEVQTDTLVLKNRSAKAQVRVLMGAGDSASLKFLGLSFADTGAKPDPLSPNKKAWGKTLEVPERSQLSYQGGRGWCSPTSTCMTLNYWGKQMERADLDIDVPLVAAGVNDPKWPGTGNWPFNTAYAGSFRGMRAYVARLSDLSEVEDWIHAGVPVIMSVLPRLLTGSDSASNGHLIVGIGFTKEGDLVANDPWARLERGQPVRRIYKRANAAAAWGASNNTVYLIYPENWKTPADRFGHWAAR